MTPHRTGIIKRRLDCFLDILPTSLEHNLSHWTPQESMLSIYIYIYIYAQIFQWLDLFNPYIFISISTSSWTWDCLPINLTEGLFALMLSLFVIYQGIIESRAPCIMHDSSLTFDTRNKYMYISPYYSVFSTSTRIKVLQTIIVSIPKHLTG